jgi:cytochrome c peroxidase
MAQIFHPSMNTVSKATIFGAVFVIAGLIAIGYVLVRSPYFTGQNIPVEQPVPFNHEHHVGGLGIQCRYCHSTVEESSFAGIPPTHTCMSCHSQVWTQAPVLQPVRDSYATGQPIQWNRVHDLGDFVYFNHSIHVAKGVGCSTCHGRVDQMTRVYKAQPMTMQWCLNCHSAPEQYLRPREEVYNMEWQAPSNQIALGQQLIQEYKIDTSRLTNCSVCHR